MSRRPSLRRIGRWASGLARLSWSERRCFAAAMVLNPSIRWLLMHRGTAAAAGFVQRHSESRFRRRQRPVDDEMIRLAKRAGAIVNRAAVEPAPTVTCLARSFTAQLLLRRIGTPAELCIGVRPGTVDDPQPAGVDGKNLLFHAWVEVGGVPINDVLDVAEQHAVFPLVGLEALLRSATRDRR